MDKNYINIFISGDFAPRLRVNDAIKRGEYDKLYGSLLSIIREADFSITNLESPLLDYGTPIVKTGPNLKAPPKSVEALHYAGFNMVTMANNHIMDYGNGGYRSSIDLCNKYGIEYVGIGDNADEARKYKKIKIKDKTIAFINLAENEWSTTTNEVPGANSLNEIEAYYQIINAKRNADYVIMIIHGGHEFYEMPSPRMVRLYRWFIDLGCDAVIGHHTHCFCGDELYKGKPIVYSLGNFLFDHPYFRTESWNEGVALMLTINDDRVNYALIPFHQCGKDVGIKLYNNREKILFEENRNNKMCIIQDEMKLKDEFIKFINNNVVRYRTYLESNHNKLIRYAIRKSFIKGSITGKYERLLLNLIRTESHREILLEILKDKKK